MNLANYVTAYLFVLLVQILKHKFLNISCMTQIVNLHVTIEINDFFNLNVRISLFVSRLILQVLKLTNI